MEQEDFKALVEEMKAFFEVGSLEKVAEKLGRSRATGITWRGKKAIPSDVLLEYNRLRAQAGQTPSYQNYKAKNPHTIEVPFYDDVCASAGQGLINDELTPRSVALPKEFLRSYFSLTHLNGLSLIISRGDSMLPTLPENCLLLVQKSDIIREGQICVVRLGLELYVKRLQKRPRPKLISDNRFYEDIELEGEEYEIVGVVVGFFKTLV